jgi:hypothetical protein
VRHTQSSYEEAYVAYLDRKKQPKRELSNAAQRLIKAFVILSVVTASILGYI